MIKILFIGCVKSSHTFFETLLTVPEAEIVGVITRKASNFNADFVSLSNLAMQYDIPCLFSEEHAEEEILAWAEKRGADIIYCFGWSYLLSEKLLNLARLGGLGYHPAMLPANRGRHPIIWALVLGLKETASTFFFLDKEADAGDVISQVAVPILDGDDAETLYEKLLEVGKRQVRSFTKALSDGSFQRIQQDSSKANNWRKRSHKDGMIDWRMPARGIYNLVRALTHPYVGASFLHKDKEIKAWKAEIVSEKILYPNLEPGRVLAADEKGLEIQCGMGIIRLTVFDDVAIEKGECLP